MSVLDGFDCLRFVKGEKRLGRLPFVVLTNSNEESDQSNRVVPTRSALRNFLSLASRHQSAAARLDCWTRGLTLALTAIPAVFVSFMSAGGHREIKQICGVAADQPQRTRSDAECKMLLGLESAISSMISLRQWLAWSACKPFRKGRSASSLSF